MENLANTLLAQKSFYLGNLALKTIIYEKEDDHVILCVDAMHKGSWYQANIIVNFSHLNTLMGKIEPQSDSFILADLISSQLLNGPFEVGVLDVTQFFDKALLIHDLKLRVKLIQVHNELNPEHGLFFVVEKIMHNGNMLVEQKRNRLAKR
ncbi:MAG: hypothetical protein ACXITV_02170 [Luteibaculaceae bacterium]